MGIIRKSLMLGTGGVVRGSSKKQRVAKAQLTELRKQTKIAETEAGVPPTPGSVEWMKADAARRKAARAASKSAPVAAPAQTPAGWYPSPDQSGRLQYWDGSQWTPSFAAPQPPS